MSRDQQVQPGRLRIEEVETDRLLPQILRLRAIAAGHVSLLPDVTPWLDPLDARGLHWGVFQDAELVAAARLCVDASFDDLPEAVRFRRGDAIEVRGPAAFMSHCVVHPRLRELRLDGALDAARLERARQLCFHTVLAAAESPRRVMALEAQGFRPLEPSAEGCRGLVLQLAGARRAAPARRRVPSRR